MKNAPDMIILGSTGSVGRQSIDALTELGANITMLAAGKSSFVNTTAGSVAAEPVAAETVTAAGSNVISIAIVKIVASILLVFIKTFLSRYYSHIVL